jgi:hypothetical protein
MAVAAREGHDVKTVLGRIGRKVPSVSIAIADVMLDVTPEGEERDELGRWIACAVRDKVLVLRERGDREPGTKMSIAREYRRLLVALLCHRMGVGYEHGRALYARIESQMQA